MAHELIKAANLGREVVADGRLTQLRKDLGLSRSAMSEFLHTNPITYSSWEKNPGVRLWEDTALRVGRFYEQAGRVLAELDVPLAQLLPFHIAATYLGIPQELLLARYRSGEIDGVDLGILGLWAWRRDLPGAEGEAA